MKRDLSCLLLCLATAATVACDGQEHWFLVAGQSNAVGGSQQPTGSAVGVVFRTHDRQVVFGIDDPFVHEPYGPAENTSPWPAFGNALPGVVGLITSAKGGNCLLQWPDKEPRWDPDHNTLFVRAIRTWEDAGKPPVRAVLWLQGECDAKRWVMNGWTADAARVAYRDALMRLADAFEFYLDAPMIAAPISLRWCRWENEDCDPDEFEPDFFKAVPIVEATEEAAALHPSIELGPFTHDLRHGVDDLHIWDVNELGIRWAERVQELLAP